MSLTKRISTPYISTTGQRQIKHTNNNIYDSEIQTEAIETTEISMESAHQDEEVLELHMNTENLHVNAPNNDVFLSSDDDQPISRYKASQQKSPLKEIGLLELSQAHNN